MRVAAVVRGPLEPVRDAVAGLPAAVNGYVVQTGAGVLVTLERDRRWPLPSRRSVIRSLQRALTSLAGVTGDVSP